MAASDSIVVALQWIPLETNPTTHCPKRKLHFAYLPLAAVKIYFPQPCGPLMYHLLIQNQKVGTEAGLIANAHLYSICCLLVSSELANG